MVQALACEHTATIENVIDVHHRAPGVAAADYVSVSVHCIPLKSFSPPLASANEIGHEERGPLPAMCNNFG